MKHAVLILTMVLATHAQEAGWIQLFDGKTLNGWRASENAGSWKVVDGMLAADGPRSHLFYAGPVKGADFKNFELKAEVMARPGANSGIYFHTAYQKQGFPSKGYEVQVANTHKGEGNYRENKKTGSLYGIRNVYKMLFRDNEWLRMHIRVQGKQIQVRVNDLLLVDYIEADPPFREGELAGRFLDRGTIALQGHDPHSQVFYRSVAIKPLPDDAGAGITAPAIDDMDKMLLSLSRQNFPVVDYHVHLKGGLTLDQALADSRQKGIFYGIAVNCGIGFPVSSDAGARDFLQAVEGRPAFFALQGEGREWPTLVSKETMAKFDYIFTDAMTFTDHRGKRVRLWIKPEVEVGDKQAFMDLYVDKILGVLKNEPIDIYVNPTFLPDAIVKEYDQLWTPERMKKVIDAAVQNDVAVEINNTYRIPNAAFIKMGKQAGLKFACGTNNGGSQLGRIDYCLETVKECGLRWTDMFVPKPDGQKKVQVRR